MDQTFAEATHFKGVYDEGGIVGMSLKDMTRYGILPLFSNMVEQGVIENPVFSYWLSRYVWWYTFDSNYNY